MKNDSMTDTQPDKVSGTPDKVKGHSDANMIRDNRQPRHRESFRFPYPVKEITEYKQSTKLGKMIPRTEIENIVNGFLTGRAQDELKKAGGVAGIMAKVLGS